MAVFAVTVFQTDKLVRYLHASIEATGTQRSGVTQHGFEPFDTCGSIAQQAVWRHPKSGGSPVRTQSGVNARLVSQGRANEIWAFATARVSVRGPLPAGDDFQAGLPNQHRVTTVRCACAADAAIYPYDSPKKKAHCVLSDISQSNSLPNLLLKLYRRVFCGGQGRDACLVNGRKHIFAPGNFKRYAVFTFGLLLVLTLKFILAVNKQLHALLMICCAAKFFAVEFQSIGDLGVVLKNSVKRCAQAGINIVASVQACDSDCGARVLALQVAAARFDKTPRSGLLLPCKSRCVLHHSSFNLSARVRGVLA